MIETSWNQRDHEKASSIQEAFFVLSDDQFEKEFGLRIPVLIRRFLAVRGVISKFLNTEESKSLNAKVQEASEVYMAERGAVDPKNLEIFDSNSSDLDSSMPPKSYISTQKLDFKMKLENWLNPQLKSLKDPFLMAGMDLATDRVVEAFEKDQKICVYADFDLDGTSGLALMLDGLKQLGFKQVLQYQPKRLSEGYGFHASAVEELSKLGVQLIITVDVGITAFEAIAEGVKNGLDVIITDHHQPEAELPGAFAVVNPNRKDDQSGLGYLCGAGVAFYFLRALKRKLFNKKLIKESDLDLRSLLDCFTIGTLTDMVPLIEDNRTLVKAGLLVLEKTSRFGLRALLDELDLNKRALTAQDVAIRFAPKLNALSRMELGVRPIDIFLAGSTGEAYQLMSTVFSNNNTRVALQEEGEREALQSWGSWNYKNDFFMAVSPLFHRGVVGLIATKIVGEKNLPTFIGSLGGDGIVTGSARMPNDRNDSLLTAMSSASQFFTRFGGHDMAAGFEFSIEKYDLIVAEMAKYFQNLDLQNSKEKRHYFDISMPMKQINEDLMSWFEKIGPFGQSFEIPILRICDLSVVSVSIMKGKHLKIRVSDQQGKKMIDLLMFSASREWLSNPPQFGDQIEVIGEVQWNYFSGKKSLQVLVKDMRVHSNHNVDSWGTDDADELKNENNHLSH